MTPNTTRHAHLFRMPPLAHDKQCAPLPPCDGSTDGCRADPALQHPQLRVGRDYRLSGDAVRRAITRNTVLVVASSPGFPHGVMDHVADIAAVRRSSIPSGGFRLPLACLFLPRHAAND